MKTSTYWGFLIVLLAIVADTRVNAQSLSDIRMRALEVAAEVAEFRGRAYKWTVELALQGEAGFSAYLGRHAVLPISVLHVEDLDRYVRKLGLYTGEVILDRSFLLEVAGIGTIAYYDPVAETIFVNRDDIPLDLFDDRLTNELSYALQDQYFDMDEFLHDPAAALNADELLARQAVAEGMASYIEWVRFEIKLNGQSPTLFKMRSLIRLFMGENTQRLRRNMRIAASIRGNIGAAERVDSIPGFVILLPARVSTIGVNMINHIRGLHQVLIQGWEHVDRLFTDPPVSTEQVLHPEKWLAGEIPDRIAWPPFEETGLFDEWELLHEDAIGELTWRIIFAEFDMADAGQSAAAGWNGDRFAMFRSRDGEALLYLLYTSWDSNGDAVEFEDRYRELLALKYPSDATGYTLSRQGRDVLVVESDRDVDTDALLAFMRTVRTWDKEAIRAVDFDGSGLVDFQDFLLFAGNFGKDELSSNYDPVYDLNQDGQVNFPDFLEFVMHFGKSTS